MAWGLGRSVAQRTSADGWDPIRSIDHETPEQAMGVRCNETNRSRAAWNGRTPGVARSATDRPAVALSDGRWPCPLNPSNASTRTVCVPHGSDRHLGAAVLVFTRTFAKVTWTRVVAMRTEVRGRLDMIDSSPSAIGKADVISGRGLTLRPFSKGIPRENAESYQNAHIRTLKPLPSLPNFGHPLISVRRLARGKGMTGSGTKPSVPACRLNDGFPKEETLQPSMDAVVGSLRTRMLDSSVRLPNRTAPRTGGITMPSVNDESGARQRRVLARSRTLD